MNATRWDVSADEYYSDEMHESNSRLAVFRESIPKYHAMFIEQIIPGKQTKGMDFGKAFHLALLEPEMYKEVIAVGPDINKLTNDYKAWKKEHADYIILDVKQETTIQKMIQGVTRNKEALKLLKAPGVVEQAIRWQHSKTGIWLKCKLDYLLETPTIVDIKTCSNSNPEEFARSCGQLDYQCQAAMYKDAVFDLAETVVRAVEQGREKDG